MRKFKCWDGEEVDLDDPNLYDRFPDDVNQLREIMFSKIGYSYCYMNFWHKETFDTFASDQKIRVDKLIKKFTEEEEANYKNALWYKGQIFIFEEETENMC